jgi:PmbA protein
LKLAETPARPTAVRLPDLAQSCLDIAKKKGATAADVEVSTSVGLNVTVRLGEVETIEHNRDKGLGVTVYLGQKRGNASTTDMSIPAIERAVDAALAIAKYTAEDPFAGLPEPSRQAVAPFPDCAVYHPWRLTTEDAIAMGQAIERAGMGVDKRINNSEGASVSMSESDFIYANSNGFIGGYPTTRHSASCTLIAATKAGMQRDYWYSVARSKDELESAEALGRKAGQRTVARLDSRRMPTGDYPVLFEAPIASGLIGALVNAVSGTSLYRKASFLMDSLGTQVASTCLNVVEDPFLARGLASGPFDAEGVTTVKREWVKDGVLQGYFLGSYSARKLGLSSTGNAGGNHNLIVQSTGEDFAALLKKMDRGLLVTELLGQGVNGVTGDYSRGAAGFWIEGGQIQYPVEEITIAGNMKDMLKGIVAVGSDTLMQGSKITGSILVERMSIAGE